MTSSSAMQITWDKKGFCDITSMYMTVVDLGGRGYGLILISHLIKQYSVLDTKCNFLPRTTTILPINVREQMENVDQGSKWYWLGALTRRLEIWSRQFNRKVHYPWGPNTWNILLWQDRWMAPLALVSDVLFRIFQRHLSSTHVTIVNVLNLLICSNEQLNHQHTSCRTWRREILSHYSALSEALRQPFSCRIIIIFISVFKHRIHTFYSSFLVAFNILCIITIKLLY